MRISDWSSDVCSSDLQSIGRLRFQFGALETRKRGGDKADNDIIDSILALQKAEPGAPVVFVSKDINLRIKAAIAGIASEDYENDRALDDFSLLYTGANPLPEDFWQRHGKDLKSWTDKGRTFYEMTVAEDEDGHPNQSEEHTSELQSLMRISYAVFCLNKKYNNTINRQPEPR